ncbi:hypothetical protein [Actinomadura rudentiformis]|uniref:hypothetical protein n=1 Tax=Actinomadura rudentiformis TaxID=359158 RepID=UPI00178C6430|nr:hypothetical protein [Actinomadura rudentiformis]
MDVTLTNKPCKNLSKTAQLKAADGGSGLLGLGAVAIINGMNWLLTAHFQKKFISSIGHSTARPVI